MRNLSNESLNLVFREARTYNAWLDRAVDESLLRQVFDLAKMGPTSANMPPIRVVFVHSKEGKERLRPAQEKVVRPLSHGNTLSNWIGNNPLLPN